VEDRISGVKDKIKKKQKNFYSKKFRVKKGIPKISAIQ
jgi:hypothetical protein